jgi:hypothetical protein
LNWRAADSGCEIIQGYWFNRFDERYFGWQSSLKTNEKVDEFSYAPPWYCIDWRWDQPFTFRDMVVLANPSTAYKYLLNFRDRRLEIGWQ